MAETLDLRPTPSTPQAPSTAPSTMSTWETPEYAVRPKTTLWYIVFGVVLALLLFTAFLMRSFLSGVVFLLIGLLVLLYSERPARAARFAISADDLRINDRVYPLRELDSFNIVESPSSPSTDSGQGASTDSGRGYLLLIRSRRIVMPLLHVPLADQDPRAVRATLLPQLKEDSNLHESLADLLAHRLGF